MEPLTDVVWGLHPEQLKHIYDYIVRTCPQIQHRPLTHVMRKFLPDVSAYVGGVYIRYKIHSKALKEAKATSLERKDTPSTWALALRLGASASESLTFVELTSQANFELAKRLTATIQLVPDGPAYMWEHIIDKVYDNPYDIALQMKHRYATSNGPVERVLEQFDLKEVERNMSRVLLFYQVSLRDQGTEHLPGRSLTWNSHEVLSREDYRLLCHDTRWSHVAMSTSTLTAKPPAQTSSSVSPITAPSAPSAPTELPALSAPPAPRTPAEHRLMRRLTRCKPQLTCRDFHRLKVIEDPIWITYLLRHPSVEDLTKFNLVESERQVLMQTRRELLEEGPPQAPGGLLSWFLTRVRYAIQETERQTKKRRFAEIFADQKGASDSGEEEEEEEVLSCSDEEQSLSAASQSSRSTASDVEEEEDARATTTKRRLTSRAELDDDAIAEYSDSDMERTGD